MTLHEGEPRSREQLKDTLIGLPVSPPPPPVEAPPAAPPARRLALVLAVLAGLTVFALLVF